MRQSTDDAHHERPARYNVSLLSVKPVEYPVWSDNPKTLFTSKTLVPHFSMRSPFRHGGRAAYQTFRAVVEMDGTVYFIGDEDRGQGRSSS